jgi:hypothetical protein
MKTWPDTESLRVDANAALADLRIAARSSVVQHEPADCARYADIIEALIMLSFTPLYVAPTTTEGTPT